MEAHKKPLEYYPIKDDENFDKTKDLYITTILNPRYKLGLLYDLNFSRSIIEESRENFIEVLNRYIREHKEITEDITLISLRNKREAVNTTWDSDSVDELYASNATLAEEDEVTPYLREKAAPKKVETIDYYKWNKDRHTTIYNMAKDYLAMPATSSPSEWLFSRVNNIITRKRNRVLSETIKYLATLKSKGLIEDKETTINNKIGECIMENSRENESFPSSSNRGNNIYEFIDDIEDCEEIESGGLEI